MDRAQATSIVDAFAREMQAAGISVPREQMISALMAGENPADVFGSFLEGQEGRQDVPPPETNAPTGRSDSGETVEDNPEAVARGFITNALSANGITPSERNIQFYLASVTAAVEDGEPFEFIARDLHDAVRDDFNVTDTPTDTGGTQGARTEDLGNGIIGVFNELGELTDTFKAPSSGSGSGGSTRILFPEEREQLRLQNEVLARELESNPNLEIITDQRTGELFVFDPNDPGSMRTLGRFGFGEVDPERKFQLERDIALGELDLAGSRLDLDSELGRSEIALRLAQVGVNQQDADLRRQQFEAEILRNPADAIFRLHSLRGADSPVDRITQADLINRIRNTRNEFQSPEDILRLLGGTGAGGGGTGTGAAGGTGSRLDSTGGISSVTGQARSPEEQAIFDRVTSNNNTSTTFFVRDANGVVQAVNVPFEEFADQVFQGQQGLATPFGFIPQDQVAAFQAEQSQLAQEFQQRQQESIAGLDIGGDVGTAQDIINNQLTVQQGTTEDLNRLRLDAAAAADAAAQAAAAGGTTTPTTTTGTTPTTTTAPAPTRLQQDPAVVGTVSNEEIAEAERIAAALRAAGLIGQAQQIEAAIATQLDTATSTAQLSPDEEVLAAPRIVSPQLDENTVGVTTTGQLTTQLPDEEFETFANGTQGTSARNRLSLVGERGPEILINHGDGSFDVLPREMLADDIATKMPKKSRFQFGTVSGQPGSTGSITQDEIVDFARLGAGPGAESIFSGGRIDPLRFEIPLPTPIQLGQLAEVELEALNTRLVNEFDKTLQDVRDAQRMRFGKPSGRSARLRF
jgi:hypothetical protein